MAGTGLLIEVKTGKFEVNDSELGSCDGPHSWFELEIRVGRDEYGHATQDN